MDWTLERAIDERPASPPLIIICLPVCLPLCLSFASIYQSINLSVTLAKEDHPSSLRSPSAKTAERQRVFGTQTPATGPGLADPYEKTIISVVISCRQPATPRNNITVGSRTRSSLSKASFRLHTPTSTTILRQLTSFIVICSILCFLQYPPSP